MLVGDYSIRWGDMLGKMMEANLRRDIYPGGDANVVIFEEMYNNIGLWEESDWVALGESLKSVALSKGMTQAEIDEAISNTDLKRVRFLAPEQESLLNKMREEHEEVVSEEEDFKTKGDVQRLVRHLRVESSLEDENDAEDAEGIVDYVIKAAKTRYAHWD